MSIPWRSLAFGCLYLGCSSCMGINGAQLFMSMSSFLIRPHTSRFTPCGRLTGSCKRLNRFFETVIANTHIIAYNVIHATCHATVCLTLSCLPLFVADEDVKFSSSSMSRTSLFIFNDVNFFLFACLFAVYLSSFTGVFFFFSLDPVFPRKYLRIIMIK